MSTKFFLPYLGAISVTIWSPIWVPAWVRSIPDLMSVPVSRGLHNPIIISPGASHQEVVKYFGGFSEIFCYQSWSDLYSIIYSAFSSCNFLYRDTEFDIKLNSDTWRGGRRKKTYVGSHEVGKILGNKFHDMFAATKAMLTPTSWEYTESSQL